MALLARDDRAPSGVVPNKPRRGIARMPCSAAWQRGACFPIKPASWQPGNIPDGDHGFQLLLLWKSWIINNVNTTPKSRASEPFTKQAVAGSSNAEGPTRLTLKYISTLSQAIYKNCIRTTHIIGKNFLPLITQVKHVHCGKFRCSEK